MNIIHTCVYTLSYVIVTINTVEPENTSEVLNNSHWKSRISKMLLNHINADSIAKNRCTLRKTEPIPEVLNQIIIAQQDSAKYLRMHIESRLNWKRDVRKKRFKLKKKCANSIDQSNSIPDYVQKKPNAYYTRPLTNRFGLMVFNCGVVPANVSKIEVIQRMMPLDRYRSIPV